MVRIRRVKYPSGGTKHQEETPTGNFKFISKDRYDELKRDGATVLRTKSAGGNTEEKPKPKTPKPRKTGKSSGGAGGGGGGGAGGFERLMNDLFANLR